ncbi:hypothetical protein, partial [Yersinia enterocolitica]|uniref:hypothetical protein n=1 Tax=Yersinia enterocolitica TaxID=630 RepID=UPI003D05F750
MTVHDAFHQKKAAYRSTPLIPHDPASAGFLFMFYMVERNDWPGRVSPKESGLPVNSTHSARPRFGGVFVYVYMV